MLYALPLYAAGKISVSVRHRSAAVLDHIVRITRADAGGTVRRECRLLLRGRHRKV